RSSRDRGDDGSTSHRRARPWPGSRTAGTSPLSRTIVDSRIYLGQRRNEAAIDEDALARDVGRAFRSQKGNQLPDVPRMPIASHRDGTLRLRSGLLIRRSFALGARLIEAA